MLKAVCCLDKLKDMPLYILSKYIAIIAPINEITARIDETATLLSIFSPQIFFKDIIIYNK